MFARASRGEIRRIPESESAFSAFKEKLLRDIDESMSLLTTPEKQTLVRVREQIRLMNVHNEAPTFRNVFVTLNKLSGSPEFHRIRAHILLELNSSKEKKSPQEKGIPLPIEVRLVAPLNTYKEALKNRRGRLSLSEKAAVDTIENLLFHIGTNNKDATLQKILASFPEALKLSEEFRTLRTEVETMIKAYQAPQKKEARVDETPIPILETREEPEELPEVRVTRVPNRAEKIALPEEFGGEYEQKVEVRRTPKLRPRARREAVGMTDQLKAISSQQDTTPLPVQESPSKLFSADDLQFTGNIDTPVQEAVERKPTTVYTPLPQELPPEIFEDKAQKEVPSLEKTSSLPAPDEELFDLRSLPASELTKTNSTLIPPPEALPAAEAFEANNTAPSAWVPNENDIWNELAQETLPPEDTQKDPLRTDPLPKTSTGSFEIQNELPTFTDGSKIEGQPLPTNGNEIRFHIVGGEYERFVTGKLKRGKIDTSRDVQVLYSTPLYQMILSTGKVDENFYPHGQCQINGTNQLSPETNKPFTFVGMMEHGYPTEGTLQIRGKTTYTGAVDANFLPQVPEAPLQSAEITPVEENSFAPEEKSTPETTEVIQGLTNDIRETREKLLSTQGEKTNLAYELTILNHFDFFLVNEHRYGDETSDGMLQAFARYVMIVENDVIENRKNGEIFDTSFQALLSRLRERLEKYFDTPLEMKITPDYTAPPEEYKMEAPPISEPEEFALSGEDSQATRIDPLEAQPTVVDGAYRQAEPTLQVPEHAPEVDIDFDNEIKTIIHITASSSRESTKEKYHLLPEEKETLRQILLVVENKTFSRKEKADRIQEILRAFPPTIRRTVPFLTFLNELKTLFGEFHFKFVLSPERTPSPSRKETYTGLRQQIDSLVQSVKGTIPNEYTTEIYSLLNSPEYSEADILSRLYTFVVENRHKVRSPEWDTFITRLQLLLTEGLTPISPSLSRTSTPRPEISLTPEEVAQDEKTRRLRTLRQEINKELENKTTTANLDFVKIRFQATLITRLEESGQFDKAIQKAEELLTNIRSHHTTLQKRIDILSPRIAPVPAERDTQAEKQQILAALKEEIKETMNTTPTAVDIVDFTDRLNQAESQGNLMRAIAIASEIRDFVGQEKRKFEKLMAVRKQINEALASGSENVNMATVREMMQKSAQAQQAGNFDDAIRSAESLLRFIYEEKNPVAVDPTALESGETDDAFTQSFEETLEKFLQAGGMNKIDHKALHHFYEIINETNDEQERLEKIDKWLQILESQKKGKNLAFLQCIEELADLVESERLLRNTAPSEPEPHTYKGVDIDPRKQKSPLDREEIIELKEKIAEGEATFLEIGNYYLNSLVPDTYESRAVQSYIDIVEHNPEERENVASAARFIRAIEKEQSDRALVPEHYMPSDAFIQFIDAVTKHINHFRPQGEREMRVANIRDYGEELQKKEKEALLEKAYKLLDQYIPDSKILAPIINNTRIRERFMQSEPEKSLLLRIRKVIEAERKQMREEMKNRQYLLIMEEPEPEKVPLLFGRKAIIERNKERERLQEKATKDPNYRYWQALESAMNTLNTVR